MSAAPRCFFCGDELAAGKREGSFQCLRCRAAFRARTDPEGCILALEVAECGADDCCRHKNSR